MLKELSKEEIKELKRRKYSDITLIHVYGQEAWHNEAFIIVNDKGLDELIDSLTKLKEGNKAVKCDGMQMDGELFNLYFINIELEKEKINNSLVSAYTDESAKERDYNKTINPSELLAYMDDKYDIGIINHWNKQYKSNAINKIKLIEGKK